MQLYVMYFVNVNACISVKLISNDYNIDWWGARDNSETTSLLHGICLDKNV